ncbi:DUF4829 domain-containing protein [Clostridium tetani]|uniref:DUF4829 domain-containing protein n=1 Tax=Clostridium tetani TaxID=1513 RepID=UPI00068D3E3C|nr:DUF4829 domain-containing protein [Clostridium tetani]RXI67904.1 DUF4830 domain-containing protein [Clostridium tetani]BDR83890.1 hypothetical protein K254310026_13010 [Clostridium tetani]BDR86714.1 hypothetical protein N071400001_13220 [Clostridium tetani]
MKEETKNNKSKILFVALGIIIIALIIGMDLKNKGDNLKMDIIIPEYFASKEPKEISIKNEKIINDIMNMIKKSEKVDSNEKLQNMKNIRWKHNRLTLTKKDGTKEEFNFSFDSLDEVGYIQKDGKVKKPSYDFFRYLCDLMEYKKFDTNIEKSVVNLFKKYNWTVDYKINTIKEKLPENLKHNAGEYPVKIYWAYNNELSKQIGLDFKDYLGKDITAEIYRLREPLPEFLKPQRYARGVVLKDKDKIIGAYIDMGRHTPFACSLDRMSLENITKKTWEQWITNHINYDDELEIKLSKMKPEDIIKEHYKALNNNDIKMILATITRENLCHYLTSNMDNHYLINKEKETSKTNIKSVKLLEVKRTHPSDEKEGEVTYEVTGDFKQHEQIVVEDGVDFNFYTLKKEIEKSGWRIAQMGK